MKLEKGLVKWFQNTKGFGFIKRDSDQGDVFVHFSSIQSNGFRRLEEGEVVYYQVQAGVRGLYASIVLPTGLIYSQVMDTIMLPESIDYDKANVADSFQSSIMTQVRMEHNTSYR